MKQDEWMPQWKEAGGYLEVSAVFRRAKGKRTERGPGLKYQIPADIAAEAFWERFCEMVSDEVKARADNGGPA